MRSTGEVMGIDTTLRAGLRQEPDRGRRPAARRRARCSCPWPTATSRPACEVGPALRRARLLDRRHRRARPRYLEPTGVPVDTRGGQGRRGDGGRRRRRPDRRRARSSWSSTRPRGRGPRADGAHIRRGRQRPPGAVPHHRGRGPGRGRRHRRLGRPPAARSAALQEYHRDDQQQLPLCDRAGAAAPGGGRGVDLDHPGRPAGAAQPGHDRVGHRRPRRRAGRLRRPGALGAVVVKSLSAEPWAGNPAAAGLPSRRRACSTASGCRTRASTPGSTTTCPPLAAAGARVVASIWGFTRRGLRAGRPTLAGRRRRPRGRGRRGQRQLPEPRGPPAHVRPLGRRHAEAVAAAAAGLRAACRCGPSSAPTSPTSPRSPAPPWPPGADAVTLVNTVLGLAIDPATGRPPARAPAAAACRARRIHPVAVRAVYDVPRAPSRTLPIVGVGGVTHRRGRGRAAAGRRRRRPGRHRHLRRSPGPGPGAGRADRAGAPATTSPGSPT